MAGFNLGAGLLPFQPGSRHAGWSPQKQPSPHATISHGAALKRAALFLGLSLLGGWGHYWGVAEVFEFDGYLVEVLRRSFRRRLSVSVHPSGLVRVSANKTLGVLAIKQFLVENRAWLQNSLRAAEELRLKHPPKVFRSGESYPFIGENYRLQIVKGPKSQVQINQGEILFSIPRREEELSVAQRQRYLKSFRRSFRQVAKKIMTDRVRFWSAKMQLQPTGLQFRGQKTIWGSCSPKNKISLNYKLIVAPIEVIDYVVIHELAHIKHKDHSQRFWNLVESFTEHRHLSRDWLRDNSYLGDFLNNNSELIHPHSLNDSRREL